MTLRLALLLMLSTAPLLADDLDYRVLDPDLKVVRLDSSDDDSFLSVRLDTAGRIFAGGRKTLFVYDLDAAGRYKPRHLLYSFPDHTWVNDIEIRGDDLYVVTVSAVYRLPGARLKRDGVTIERLLWGVPNGHVHQCFHACAWGPDGDLYVSMGDPLWYYGDFARPDHWGHWTMFFKPVVPNDETNRSGDKSPAPQPSPRSTGARESAKTVRVGGQDWATMPYNGVGGVFRIRPDGTNLRSFSRGLRNPCGLCFDKHWNLFTNDNDHEGLPSAYVPGRMLHVTEGSYFSWPRGWVQSKSPDRADILPSLNENLGRFVPVLQTYYSDGYLPEKYDNNLLVARWCRRQVTRFPLEAKGNTFTAKEHVLLEGSDQARPVGVCVGRGGRVFVTMCYMAQNEGSPTYRSDLVVITRKDDPDTMPFDGYDITSVEPTKLREERRRTEWNRSSTAFAELLRRWQESPKTNPHPGRHPPDPPRPFGEALTIAILGPILVEPLAKSFGQGFAKSLLEEMLVEVERDPEGTLKQIRQDWNDGKRERLREGDFDADFVRACLAYSSLPLPKLTAAYCRAPEQPFRMMGVLIAGFRLTIPPVDAKLPAAAPLAPQQKEEANIILFADEKEPIDLRKFGRVGNYTVAEHWKALKHTAEQEQLFALLVERLGDDDDKVRLQAAHFLSLLNDPRSEPKISAVTADVQDKRLNLQGKLEHVRPQVWMLGPVPDADGFKTVHSIETAAIDLAAKYAVNKQSFDWKLTKTSSPDRPLYNFNTLFGPSPNSSVYSLIRFDVPTAQRMQLLVGSEDGVRVWHNGKLVFTNDAVRPLQQLDDVVPLDLLAGSNDILVRVRMQSGRGGQYLHFKHLGDVRFTLPEKPDGLSLAERLNSAGSGSQPIDAKFLSVDWIEAVKAGDVARGKKLFGAESLGCAKSHAATANQPGGGGPSLADSGKRFSVPYLVESVLAPNKVISPVFKSATIQTTDGKVITGLVVSETGEKLEVLLPDTKRVSINKADIEARKLADISAMPQGVVKTPEELRDVIAYLLSNPTDSAK